MKIKQINAGADIMRQMTCQSNTDKSHMNNPKMEEIFEPVKRVADGHINVVWVHIRVWDGSVLSLDTLDRVILSGLHHTFVL